MVPLHRKRSMMSKRSITVTLYTRIFTLISFLVILTSIMLFLIETSVLHNTIEKSVQSGKQKLSEALREPILLSQKEQINSILLLEMEKREILYIQIRDAFGEIISGYSKIPDESIVPENKQNQGFMDHVKYKTIFLEFSENDQYIGFMEIGFTDYFMSKDNRKWLSFNIIGVVSFLMTGLVLALNLIKKNVLEQLSNLAIVVKNFGNKDFSARVRVPYKYYELEELTLAFNKMADLIQGYSIDLEKLVAERTNQLVDAEKLAFLGSLVTGVAHEINTPVGIAVTASSHLQERGIEILRSFRENSLTRGMLENFLTEIKEATGILLLNLGRASDFVRSFKQIAVDQASEVKRIFQLKPYLEEIVFSLKPTLRKTAHRIDIDVPESLSLDLIPGMLSQIFTNLIINSIQHGFDKGSSGHISIIARVHSGKLVLQYRDNGKGIPKEYIQNVFRPFFTTKRDQGGTGLGLYIISNIVAKLSGTISCSSEPGQGVEFVITLPSETIAESGDNK